MSNHETLLADFVNITDVDEERAKFYLESSAWQLEVALASFYENDGGQEENVQVSPEHSDEHNATPVSIVSPQNKSNKSSTKFATVTNLNNSSSDEEGQAFYAGGSEHSGQQVLGPSKKKDFVSEMFKSVQEHGAEVVEQQTTNSASAFGGVGYKLGQSSNDSEMVPAKSSKKLPHTEIILKLWRDGFSVNDGNIRSYTDPVNREFLESIKKGEIPSELIHEARGSEVHLNMEDHRHEEFVKVKTKLQPFSGQGHTLGRPTPSAVGSSSINIDEKDLKSSEEDAKIKMNIDRSQPLTHIQIRLADGSRLLGEFNHSHTVADIRRYITMARPQYEGRSFNLLTTFPSHELPDNQTVSEAGIINAAIMQRLT